MTLIARLPAFGFLAFIGVIPAQAQSTLPFSEIDNRTCDGLEAGFTLAQVKYLAQMGRENPAYAASDLQRAKDALDYADWLLKGSGYRSNKTLLQQPDASAPLTMPDFDAQSPEANIRGYVGIGLTLSVRIMMTLAAQNPAVFFAPPTERQAAIRRKATGEQRDYSVSAAHCAYYLGNVRDKYQLNTGRPAP